MIKQLLDNVTMIVLDLGNYGGNGFPFCLLKEKKSYNK